MYIWEVAPWEIVTWEVALWKIPLGKYLTTYDVPGAMVSSVPSLLEL